MGLETASYINGLSPSNPLSTDPLGQADDHIRLIKSVLKSTFPNITGPVTATQATLNKTWVPIGTIVMWSPSAGAIPDGWGICDGSTYTRSDGVGTIVSPNLTDKFIVGAGVTYAAGSSGGSLNTSSGGSHSHGGASGSFTLTTDHIPSHVHTGNTSEAGNHTHSSTIGFLGAGSTGLGSGGTTAVTMQGVSLTYAGNHSHAFTTNSTGSGLGHAHSIGADGTHNHTILPPYYALAYIMRI